MVIFHTHKGGILICFTIRTSFFQYLFLLFIFFYIGRKVLFYVPSLGFFLIVFRVLFQDFIDFFSCFFNFLRFQLFKVWRFRIAVLFVSDGFGVVPHLLLLLGLFHFIGFVCISPFICIT